MNPNLLIDKSIALNLVSRILSNVEAESSSNDFDYIKNCGQLCPLECQSTSYRIIETKFTWSELDTSLYSNDNQILTNLDKKLNLKNLTAEQLSEGLLGLNLFFESL